MKICAKCLLKKEESSFYRKNAKRKQSYCKECFNAYCVSRWIQRKKDAVHYKGGKCKDCGYCKNYGSLEFHHLDPKTKDFEWVKLRLKGWKRITEELDKCDLLCRNCHGERHNPDLAF